MQLIKTISLINCYEFHFKDRSLNLKSITKSYERSRLRVHDLKNPKGIVFKSNKTISPLRCNRKKSCLIFLKEIEDRLISSNANHLYVICLKIFLDNCRLVFVYFRRTKTTVSEKQDKHVRQFEKSRPLDNTES